MLTPIKKCQDGLQTLVGIRDDRDGKEGVAEFALYRGHSP
jgi:hypothetical protein